MLKHCRPDNLARGHLSLLDIFLDIDIYFIIVTCALYIHKHSNYISVSSAPSPTELISDFMTSNTMYIKQRYIIHIIHTVSFYVFAKYYKCSLHNFSTHMLIKIRIVHHVTDFQNLGMTKCNNRTIFFVHFHIPYSP